MTFRPFLALLAIVLTGWFSGKVEAAEDPETLDKLVQMNRKALDQLRVGQNAEARDALLEALALGKKAGLTGHQIQARSHLHLGAVYLTGFGDKDKALRHFESAVKINPGIKLTPAVLTPSVQETFDLAQKGGAPVEAAPPAAAETAPAPAAPEATPAAPLAAVDAPPKGRVGLRGRKGRPLTQVAAAPAPAPASAEAAEPSVEAAVSAALEEEEETASPVGFWVSLGVGSGVGFHLNRTLESRPDFGVPTGFSTAALAHFAPEVGYRVSEKLAFSVQSRHQLVPRSGTVEMGPDQRAGFAHAFFARAHYRLASLGEKVALWGTATAGGGSAIRLYVPANPSVGLSSSDTVAAGPVAFGPGVSVVYQASRRIGMLAELRTLITVGGFAALADFNLGVSCAF